MKKILFLAAMIAVPFLAASQVFDPAEIMRQQQMQKKRTVTLTLDQWNTIGYALENSIAINALQYTTIVSSVQQQLNDAAREEARIVDSISRAQAAQQDFKKSRKSDEKKDNTAASKPEVPAAVKPVEDKEEKK